MTRTSAWARSTQPTTSRLRTDTRNGKPKRPVWICSGQVSGGPPVFLAAKEVRVPDFRGRRWHLDETCLHERVDLRGGPQASAMPLGGVSANMPVLVVARHQES